MAAFAFSPSNSAGSCWLLPYSQTAKCCFSYIPIFFCFGSYFDLVQHILQGNMRFMRNLAFMEGIYLGSGKVGKYFRHASSQGPRDALPHLSCSSLSVSFPPFVAFFCSLLWQSQLLPKIQKQLDVSHCFSCSDKVMWFLPSLPPVSTCSSLSAFFISISALHPCCTIILLPECDARRHQLGYN